MPSYVDLSNLVELIQWRAQDQFDRRAYTFLVDGATQETHIDYTELDQKARVIASHLQCWMPGRSRALLLYSQGLDFITAFFGCLYAGVIAVPVQPPKRNQSPSRLQAIATDAQAAVALTTQSMLRELEPQIASSPALATLRWIESDLLSSEASTSWQKPSLDRDSLAFLQYTSGSTGTPKGVMVSHGNLLYNSEYIQKAFELTPESVSVCWLPSFHDMGLIDGIIQPLYTGFLGMLMSPVAFLQKPVLWLQAISRYRATHCGSPNQGYELCTRKVTTEQCESLDLSSWQSAYSGAEPIRRTTLEQFAAKFQPYGFQASSFYPCYGMAESTLMISGGAVKAEPVYCAVDANALAQNQIVTTLSNTRDFVGVGHAWLETKITIVNPDSCTRCLPEQVGEIWVSGDSVAQGYWNQPGQTQQTFHAYLADTKEGKYLRTGDLGFMREGELFITGRVKDTIILWGRNHYPQDIELTVQQSHSALRFDCGAAFAVDVANQERLVIVQEVERSALRQLEVGEVVKHIRRAVSERHDVQVYAIALLRPASIPKTSSGKIQRHACRTCFLDNSLEVVNQWRQKLSNSSNIYAEKHIN